MSAFKGWYLKKEKLTNAKQRGSWGVQTAASQQLGEQYLPEVIDFVMSSTVNSRQKFDSTIRAEDPDIPCTPWHNVIRTLYLCLHSNTSAIKRVLKIPGFLQRILSTCKEHTCYMHYNELMLDVLCVMIICVLGSRPNPELWQSMAQDIDTLSVIVHMFLQGEMQCEEMFSTFLKFLEVVHGVELTVQVMPQEHRKYPPFGPSTTPAMRLDKYGIEFQFLCYYKIYCSNPACGKLAPSDQAFAKCEQCSLCRYCSQECQTQHWNQAGHKEACSTDRFLMSEHISSSLIDDTTSNDSLDNPADTPLVFCYSSDQPCFPGQCVNNRGT